MLVPKYMRPSVRAVRPALQPVLKDAEFRQCGDCVAVEGEWTLQALKKALAGWKFDKNKFTFTNDKFCAALHGVSVGKDGNTFRTFTLEVFRVVNC